MELDFSDRFALASLLILLKVDAQLNGRTDLVVETDKWIERLRTEWRAANANQKELVFGGAA